MMNFILLSRDGLLMFCVDNPNLDYWQEPVDMPVPALMRTFPFLSLILFVLSPVLLSYHRIGSNSTRRSIVPKNE